MLETTVYLLAFILGFVCGMRVHIIRYVPIEKEKTKTPDLYPPQGDV